jgi:hypothetical protein
MIDLRNLTDRMQIIAEINNDENKSRKSESLKRFEVYKERQGRYIEKKLREEFSKKTVDEMRKILSINLCKKIIDDMASIYKHEPSRMFTNTDDDQRMQIEEWYYLSKVNQQLKKANRYYKLQDQVALQVVPRDKKIQLRVLLPHQYDVIPNENDPEGIPYAYIISVFDKMEDIRGFEKEIIDGVNQKIADPDDYKKNAKKRFEVWTNDLNFIMDGNGQILSETVENPLGELPFVDIVSDRDFEYWARRSNGVVEFSIDFGVLLSDLANIIRLQGYAQAIVYASKFPENIIVGPNHILFMEQDPNSTLQPRFEFANPSPDLGSSLEFLEMNLKLFLSSKGVDTKALVARGDVKSYSSGLERLLAMIESFEASKDDMDLFYQVEQSVFYFMKRWVEIYRGSDVIDQMYYSDVVSDDTELEVKFYEPQSIQTKSDLEASIEKRLSLGLITKADALMILDGMTREMAEEKLLEINSQKMGVPNGQDNEESDKSDDEEIQQNIQG